jgi:hypothetical protein
MPLSTFAREVAEAIPASDLVQACETIEDKLKTVLKLRSATVNDIPVLMHMARALAEQQGLVDADIR